jgi:hypothetical protein
VTGYLFLMMVTISPRVWGYSDYSQEIKNKVPPQTKDEKRLALLVGLPWFIFTFGFPIYSTTLLKAKLLHVIPIQTAFLNLLVMFLLVSFGDLVILDWLIVSKITPQFVIIPGTEARDYKDFSHHYKAQLKAALVIIPILLLIAGLISCL